MFTSTRRAFLVAALGTAALTGCATANGPLFSGPDPVQQGGSNIYLYRGSALFAVAQSFTLDMDGKTVGQLYNASYQKIATTPGKHALEVAPGGFGKKSTLEVMLEPNKTYFYEYDFVTGPLANPIFIGASIQPREQVKALDDLKALKRAE